MEVSFRRRLKKLALFPIVATSSIGLALIIVYLSFRAGGPIHDPIHQD